MNRSRTSGRPSETIAGNACTVQRKNGSFCDAPSVEGAPFPICGKHAARLLAHYMEQSDWLPKPPEFRDDEDRMTRPSKAESVVYYVSFGDDTVKIGTTINLKNRLATFIRCEDDVLAVEPGDQRLEAVRHRQFAADRLERGTSREMFRLSPALKSHIDMLNKRSCAAG